MIEFAYPVRPYKLFYVAATYLDPGYTFGGKLRHHKGIDLNLHTGGDSDLGYPVQSMFPGWVRFAGVAGSWGGIVLIESDAWVQDVAAGRLGEANPVFAVQYAHLMQLSVRTGDVVNAGDHIGSIGKGAHNQYLAHLHLEVRRSDLPANDPQGTDDAALRHVRQHYHDPEVVMAKLPFSDYGNVMPQRRLVAPVRGVGIEGGYYDDKKVVATNFTNGKFYFRSSDPGALDPGAG